MKTITLSSLTWLSLACLSHGQFADFAGKSRGKWSDPVVFKNSDGSNSTAVTTDFSNPDNHDSRDPAIGLTGVLPSIEQPKQEGFGWGYAGGLTSPILNDNEDLVNYLVFTGEDNFRPIAEDQPFQIGTLEYHNGSVFNGTAVTGVTLDLALNLEGIPGIPDIINTFYEFELQSVLNITGTEVGDADFVFFPEPTAPVGFFDDEGNEYLLNLSFGEVTGPGFSEVDQFFVYEEEIATAELIGVVTIDPNLRLPEPNAALLVSLLGCVQLARRRRS